MRAGLAGYDWRALQPQMAMRKSDIKISLYDLPKGAPGRCRPGAPDAQKSNRADAVRTLNAWCRGELEIIERGFTERNEAESAAKIRVEREALEKPPLEIVGASYGAGKRVDVTFVLRKAIRFNRIEIPAGNSLAGDPHPYMQKSGSITYRLEGGPEKKVNFGESGTIKIP